MFGVIQTEFTVQNVDNKLGFWITSQTNFLQVFFFKTDKELVTHLDIGSNNCNETAYYRDLPCNRATAVADLRPRNVSSLKPCIL